MIIDLRLCRFFQRFCRDTGGNILALSAILLPVILGAGFFAVEHGHGVVQKAELQKATDAAALAAVREMRFISSDRTENRDLSAMITAIATGMVRQATGVDDETLTVSAQLVGEDTVRVDAALEVPNILGSLTGTNEQLLQADATAEIFGAQNICALVLQPTDRSVGVRVADSTSIAAENCGLHSNSPKTKSIVASGSAYLDMNYICAAGGYEGSESNSRVPVFTDCSTIMDPFTERPHPDNSSIADGDPCTTLEPSSGMRVQGATVETYTDETILDYFPNRDGAERDYAVQVLSTGSHTLSPGVYCGGLVIRGDADVWLEEGIYIFRGAPLVVEDEARLSGDHVGLYFDGMGSYFMFLDNAEVVLSAPRNGVMAGLLIHMPKVCDRAVCATYYASIITSSRVRSLLGTIYIPDDLLLIDTSVPVSEEAAFTIVVTSRLDIRQSATLVLNTDYAATDVPQPDEIKGLMENARLVE